MISPLVERVKQRKLFQWSVAYLAGAWVVLQVLDLVSDAFGWPAGVQQGAIVLLGVGFLAALVLAWYHGEQGAQKVGGVELLMLAVLLLIAGTGVALISGDTHPAAVAEPRPSPVVPSAEQGSVAVLPFVNMSSDPEQEYFSDGLTEELLNVLAQIPELRVAARTSAFSFKNTNVPVDSIGRALNVAHLLEGSVRKAGDRVRITAQLVNAGTGYHLWSGTYDRELKDIFAVQDEISRAITEQLRVKLAADATVARDRATSVGAHELYLLGLDRWSHRNSASLHQAVDFFRRAVAADSGYAQAHAGLALAYAVLPQYDPAVAARDVWAQGRAAARLALALDPRSAEARAALSQMAAYSGDLTTAEREARAAIRLNPNYVTAHQWLAEALMLQNRLPEARAAADRAAVLDPLSPLALNVRAGVLAALGETDDAFRTAQRVIALDPDFLLGYLNLGGAALSAGRYDLARFALRNLAVRTGQDSALADLIVDGVAVPSRRPALWSVLGSGDVRKGLDPVYLASLYELTGQRDSALAVAAALADDPVQATNFRFVTVTDPVMKALAEDPRLPAALRPPRARGAGKGRRNHE